MATMMLGIMFLGSAVASTMILTKMTLAWLGGGEKGSFTANCGIKGALRKLFEEEARSSFTAAGGAEWGTAAGADLVFQNWLVC